ncbi:MAG: histidine kinase dimerization/phospho-acceptor domain-containing protein, partial [Hyphomonadaceae bacterium]|nr:histidine kinase dimerization/phospho-acceptor domain-containing protein [Hyphomonadaceae bacterium]
MADSLNTQPEISPSRVRGSRRASDFRILGGVATAVLLALALFGQTTWTAAVAGSLIVLAVCIGWFFGTVDPANEIEAEEKESALAETRRRLETERRFRVALIEALPEVAMYIDSQGKIEGANAAARKELRFTAAGPMLTAVVRRPELLNAVDAARNTGEAQQFEIVQREGTDRHFACVASPLGAGVLLTLHDYTDIKRMEMARVDFLANASHELRTPLTSLSGFIETMRGPARDDPEARDRFLEIMQSQADRMRRLISDLLSLSRIELVEHRPPEGVADLAAVVIEARDALAPVAKERGVELRVSAGSGPVNVIGARDELTQVVQNLIDNAIKYSEKGDVVDIEVRAGVGASEASTIAGRRWEEAGRMSIASAPTASNTSSFAVLRVTDSGPGIERQYLPRLSERFYRVDQGRGLKPGTGLGLAIVKHVVQ